MTNKRGGSMEQSRLQTITFRPRLAAMQPPITPGTRTIRNTRNTGFTYPSMTSVSSNYYIKAHGTTLHVLSAVQIQKYEHLIHEIRASTILHVHTGSTTAQ